jgi:hypothetical protein
MNERLKTGLGLFRFSPFSTTSNVDLELVKAGLQCVTATVGGATALIAGIEVGGRIIGRPGLGVEVVKKIVKDAQNAISGKDNSGHSK